MSKWRCRSADRTNQVEYVFTVEADDYPSAWRSAERFIRELATQQPMSWKDWHVFDVKEA